MYHQLNGNPEEKSSLPTTCPDQSLINGTMVHRGIWSR